MAVSETRLETLDSIFTHFADEINGLADHPTSFGAKLEAGLHKHKVHYGSNSESWTKFMFGLLSTVFASDVAFRNYVTQAFVAATNDQVWFAAIVGREQQMKIFSFEKDQHSEYIESYTLERLKDAVEDSGFSRHMVHDALERVGFVTILRPDEGSWYSHYNENNQRTLVRALAQNSPFTVSTTHRSIQSRKLFEGIRGILFYPLKNMNGNRVQLSKLFSPMTSSDFEPTRQSPSSELSHTFFEQSIEFCQTNIRLLNFHFANNEMSFNDIYFFVKGATMNFESTFHLDVISRYGADGSVVDLTIMPKSNKGHFVSKAMPTILTLSTTENEIFDDRNQRLNGLLPSQIQTENPHFVYLDARMNFSPVRFSCQQMLHNAIMHNNRIEHYSLFDVLWSQEINANFKIIWIYNEIMKSIYLGYKDNLPSHIFGHLLGVQLSTGVETYKFVYQNVDIAPFVHTFVCSFGQKAIVLNLLHHQIDGQSSNNPLPELSIGGYLKPHLTARRIQTIEVYNVELGPHLRMPLIPSTISNFILDVRLEPHRGWGAETIYYKQPFYYNPDHPLEGIVSCVQGVRVSEMGFVADSHLGGNLQRVETMNSVFPRFWFEHLHNDYKAVITRMIRQALKCEQMRTIHSVHANVMFAAVMSCNGRVVRISDRQNFWVTGILFQSSDQPFSLNIVHTGSLQTINHDTRNQISIVFRHFLRNTGSEDTSSSLHLAILERDERHGEFGLCFLRP